MSAFLNELLFSVLLNLAQLALGSLAIYLVTFIKRNHSAPAVTGVARYSTVIASSLIGMALPFNAFVTVPIVLAGGCLGIETAVLFPMLVSGLLFNMSMPFTEITFVWHANIIRIVLAFVAGAISGLWMLARKPDSERLFSRNILDFYKTNGFSAGYWSIFKKYVESAGLFLLAGSLLLTAYNRYLADWLLNLFYLSPAGPSAINTFARLDFMNPFFLAAGQIFNRIIDFTALAAFIYSFRAKRLLQIYLYVAVLAALLVLPILIKI